MSLQMPIPIKPAANRISGAEHSERAGSQRARFLVVSENPDHFAEIRGYFDWAQSHAQLCLRAASSSYDAILIDLIVPITGTNGFRLAKLLRAESAVTSPVFLVSEAALPTEVIYAKRCGASELIAHSNLRSLLQPGSFSRKMPDWYQPLAATLSCFIATEADWQLRQIISSLERRHPGVVPDLARVIKEASALLDDEARASFKRIVRTFR